MSYSPLRADADKMFLIQAKHLNVMNFFYVPWDNFLSFLNWRNETLWQFSFHLCLN